MPWLYYESSRSNGGRTATQIIEDPGRVKFRASFGMDDMDE